MIAYIIAYHHLGCYNANINLDKKRGMRMKKAIIFDMDGLLIDSERVTFEEYCLKLKQLNYEFNEDIYRRCLGKNKTGIYQVLLDHFGDSFQSILFGMTFMFLRSSTATRSSVKKRNHRTTNFLKGTWV